MSTYQQFLNFYTNQDPQLKKSFLKFLKQIKTNPNNQLYQISGDIKTGKTSLSYLFNNILRVSYQKIDQALGYDTDLSTGLTYPRNQTLTDFIKGNQTLKNQPAILWIDDFSQSDYHINRILDQTIFVLHQNIQPLNIVLCGVESNQPNLDYPIAQQYHIPKLTNQTQPSNILKTFTNSQFQQQIFSTK